MTAMIPVTETAMSSLQADFRAHLVEVRHLSPRSVTRYTRVLARFGDFLTKGTDAVQLADVDKDHIELFLRQLGGGKASWNARLTALRAFYRYLSKTGRLTVDPSRLVERIRGPSKEPIPLSFDEMLRLVEAVETASSAYRARNLAIVHVFFHCAVRVAELVSINRSQVDFERRAFLGVRAKYDKELVLPFNDVVADHLERYLEERDAKHGKSGPLFLSDRGHRLSVRAVQDLLTRYGKRAGIDRPVTPHLLRHASATEHAANGTPLPVIQSLLGHRSIKTTQRYVHANGAQQRDATNALAKRWHEKADSRCSHTKKSA